MKLRFNPFSLLGLGIATVAVLLPAGAALAQPSDSAAPAIMAGVMLLFGLAVGAAFYVYFALALQTIATKTRTENAWLAWIPIANLFLMLFVAKKPLWWFLLFLIPLVNLVFLIIVWMGMAEARGKPNWWGVLIIIPIANLVVPGYLAWAD